MLLTEQEIKRIGEGNTGSWQDDLQFARAIESAVLEKLKAQDRLKPVAWLITVEKQDGSKETYPAMGRFKDVKASCDFGEPIPLYEHPLPPADVVRDAERYRWLRDEAYLVNPLVAVVWKRNDDRNESEWVNTVDGHSLDCHIDAAMEGMK